MNGEWIILVWALVSVIFLVKLPIIRELFAKVRKMSAVGIICMVLSLGFLANVSYTKDGISTNQSASQTVSQSAENLSSSTQSSVLTSAELPDFWNDDPTDTDGDGIPDLWEKWTHGKKLVADSDLDRDGDGLTDLEEFLTQTDPRTTDTDGDSFSDFFEVANGMNPVVSEDFTPVEPDTNHNGLPDIWEQGGYDSSFRDADHNGFDDYYERYYLPAASDDNFDVIVNIYSTRSVLLIWESGEDWNSIVMLPTTATSVKLRLPFGADTEVKLHPSPYGTDMTLYLGCSETTKEQLCTQIALRSQETSQGVNIRFTTVTTSEKVKVIEIKCLDRRRLQLFGQLANSSDASFRNENPMGKAYVYMNVIREASSSEKFEFDNNMMKTKIREKCEIATLFLFSSQELMSAIAATTEHETGHLLGLVSPDYLGGTKGLHNRNILVNGWIMNASPLTPMVYRLGSRSTRRRTWKTQDLMYLSFILPEGK